MALKYDENVFKISGMKFEFDGDLHPESSMKLIKKSNGRKKEANLEIGNFFESMRAKEGSRDFLNRFSRKIAYRSNDERTLNDKAKLAAKVIEAEYLHEETNLGKEDVVGEEMHTVLEEVGTERFDKLLEGAKKSLDEEAYADGFEYISRNGTEIATEEDVYARFLGRGLETSNEEPLFEIDSTY